MQLRYQLSTTKMGTLSIADYFQNVKQLTDTLAIKSNDRQPNSYTLGVYPLDTKMGSLSLIHWLTKMGTLDTFEVISYLIDGLSSDYDSLVTSAITKVDPMTLEEFYGYLLTHEQCLEQLHSIITDASYPTANAGTNNLNNNVSHGRGQRSNNGYSTNSSHSFTSLVARGVAMMFWALHPLLAHVLPAKYATKLDTLLLIATITTIMPDVAKNRRYSW